MEKDPTTRLLERDRTPEETVWPFLGKMAAGIIGVTALVGASGYLLFRTTQEYDKQYLKEHPVIERHAPAGPKTMKPLEKQVPRSENLEMRLTPAADRTAFDTIYGGNARDLQYRS